MKAVEVGLILALAITVSGQLLYHAVAKSVSAEREPWEIISGAYLIGFLLVTTIGIYLGNISLAGVMSRDNVGPAVLIGVAVACVEMGYLYAYRNGLSVSIGALSVLAITTVALIPIAAYIFKEPVHFTRFVGVAVTIFGVWLMQANIKI